MLEQFACRIHGPLLMVVVIGKLTLNALGGLISFPSVREKKFTDITDTTTSAQIPLCSASSGEYRMRRHFKCVWDEGEQGSRGSTWWVSFLTSKVHGAGTRAGQLSYLPWPWRT